MNQWNVFIRIVSDEEICCENLLFDIPAKFFTPMVSAVSDGIPLVSCEFYPELINWIESQIVFEDYLDIPEERPDPDDYDDETEYEADLEDYERWIRDHYRLESVTVEDPTDLGTLLAGIGDLRFPVRGGGILDLEIEADDEFPARYYVALAVDKDGKATAVQSVIGEAAGDDVVSSSGWNNLYPDFEFIMDYLHERYGE